ncbi:hypothetical protein C2S51_035199 [Perilla frutescens var. frutescens]|nr:hypothetical protein C2S51_035199 [Perilla frutescens var. frutescens]
MAEEGNESRFVCKLCSKRFPCGKSLGGHMSESGNLLQSGYGLRENPKKTWRAVDSRLPLPQEKVCKQCGKGFQSMKALCGHMACHSDKDKGTAKDDHDHSWTSENQKMVFDSQSETEVEEKFRLRTRSSKSRKCKKVVEDLPFVLANNGSSSVSEIDGQEQEEVAKCLMMLSRDSGIKGGVNSVVESSDNNSVVMETKSSSIEMRIIGRKEERVDGHVLNEGEVLLVEKNVLRKLEDGGSLDGEAAKMEDSDSGYFLDECAKAESDVSVDWFRRNGGFSECRKPQMSLKLMKSWRNELSKSSKGNSYDDDDEEDDDDDGLMASRKRKHGSENHEVRNGSARVMKSGGELCSNSQKKSKYECFNCKKVFKSYQALGGHRPCHKRSNASCESRDESGENSPDAAAAYYRTNAKFVESSSKKKPSAKSSSHLADKKSKSKKNNNKPHVCPFCDRVFKNGQALGGHKRSHFLTGHESNNLRSSSSRVEKPDLLDLNLPAPEADDDESGGQFFSW